MAQVHVVHILEDKEPFILHNKFQGFTRQVDLQGSLLRVWFNLNPSMDK